MDGWIDWMERRKNVLNGDFRFQLFSAIFDEGIAFSSTLCRILIASNHVKNTWKTHKIGLHSMNYVFFNEPWFFTAI